VLEPTYMNGKGVVQIGNVVTTPDNVRAVVIGTDGSFVRVHGFGTHRETGDIVVLNWVHDLPASECVLLDPYAVKLLGGLRNERRRCQESQARAHPGRDVCIPSRNCQKFAKSASSRCFDLP